MKNNWICIEEDIGEASPLFIKRFALDEVNDVSLNITAIGLYKAFVNGKEITKRIFTPGLTVYNKRVMFQTYDISSLLNKGENSLEVYLAPGWAVGCYGLADTQHWMGDKPALNLEVTKNGVELFHSDASFAAKETFITLSDIYNGETHDYTKKDVKDLTVIEINKDINLVENEGEDILEKEIVKAKQLIISPKGEKIIDFGQNLTGYVCIKNPKKGHYLLNFGEVLDKEGNFYNANYRASKNDIEYTVGDEPIEELKPWFSFQGYRYVLVKDWPGEINLEDVISIVVYSNIKRISYFECGNAKINQLYSNVIWGQKDNFLDVPTDCPQRDERLGWLGDAQVFAKTACYNFDCEEFYKKWLNDVALEQTDDGAVQGFTPHVLPGWRVSPGWSDACSIVPYQVYQAKGNKDILAKNLPVIEKWVEYMHKFGPSENLWIGHFAFGDWLGMDLPSGSWVGATQKDFISTAYFYKTTMQCAEIRSILGLDNSYYLDLAKNIRKEFRSYFLKDGLPVLNYTLHPFDPNKPDIAITQTSLSMLLCFGLLDENEKPLVAKTLNQLVLDNGTRLSTGFLGTPLLLSALSDNGYPKTAMDLLFQEAFPSWLYSVNRGATTIWEHWDSVNEEGEFWSTDMNSFNHYSYGAVMEWVIENAVGLKRLAPGYSKIAIKPIYDVRLGDISFKIDTPNGKIEIKHTLVNGEYVTSVNADPRIEIVK